jgi:hypothetical protein
MNKKLAQKLGIRPGKGAKKATNGNGARTLKKNPSSRKSINHLDTLLDRFGYVGSTLRVGLLRGRVGVAGQRTLGGVGHRRQGCCHPAEDMASSIWDCCVAMFVFVLIIFTMQYHNLPTAILTRRR